MKLTPFTDSVVLVLLTSMLFIFVRWGDGPDVFGPLMNDFMQSAVNKVRKIISSSQQFDDDYRSIKIYINIRENKCVKGFKLDLLV
jgi:hypothetical protein